MEQVQSHVRDTPTARQSVLLVGSNQVTDPDSVATVMWEYRAADMSTSLSIKKAPATAQSAGPRVLQVRRGPVRVEGRQLG